VPEIDRREVVEKNTVLRSVETQSYQPSKSNNGPLWQIIFRRYKNKKERKVL
jgi:hypothetical protein